MAKPGAWKLRVWENFGWHWDLRQGPATVGENGCLGFTCMIASWNGPAGSGSGLWTDSKPKYSRDPQKAFEDARMRVDRFARKVTQYARKIDELV